MLISDWSSDVCSSDLAGVDHLAQIVRGDVGRHADRDAAGTVDEQVGEARGQDCRLFAAGVVVGLEVDRVLVEVVQQHHRGPGEPRLGITHRGRRVGVHRRSEEHTSELLALMRISYAVFCLKKKKETTTYY